MERNSNPNHHYNNGSNETRSPATTSSDFVLQWGNRKRLRCMKFQAKVRDNGNNLDSAGLQPGGQRTGVRVDRRVVRSDHNNKDLSQPSNVDNSNGNPSNGGNGYLNLRQRPASPSHRILRNSESSLAMRGQSNGVRGLASPDRVGAGGHDRKGSNNNLHHHSNGTKNNSNNNNDTSNNINGSASSDSKKGGGTSSGSDAIPAVWPPKFVIALTNKEKEEDFMAIKGSKLPQRPKKRAKFIQRSLNPRQSNVFGPWREQDMILILGQVVLIILWMTMEEHYTHESVIFVNGGLLFGGIHLFGPPGQLTKAEGTKYSRIKETGGVIISIAGESGGMAV